MTLNCGTGSARSNYWWTEYLFTVCGGVPIDISVKYCAFMKSRARGYSGSDDKTPYDALVRGTL